MKGVLLIALLFFVASVLAFFSTLPPDERFGLLVASPLVLVGAWCFHFKR